jgi:hypothetical protein
MIIPESVIFNCTGAGARELRRDNDMKVAKGLTLLLKIVKGAKAVSVGDGDFDVVSIPGARVKLGCGYTEEGTDSAEPDKKDCEMIIRKAGEEANSEWARSAGLTGILEEVRNHGAKAVTEAITGIFATRKTGPKIAASKEEKLIIDNYAHGYCGMTLSWGAAEVAVMEMLRVESQTQPSA